MTVIEWERRNKSLEARFWCPKCKQSNITTAYDSPEFWRKNYAVVPVYCDRCKSPIYVRKRPTGLEITA